MCTALPRVGRDWRAALALAGALLAGTGHADRVTLRSGAVITGEIQAENAYELRILVSRTASGEIQTIKVIDQDAVAGIQRSSPTVAVEPDPAAADAAAAEPIPAATPAAGTGTLATWHDAIRDADAETAVGKYDEAITAFRTVIEQTGKAAGSASTNGPARLEVLKVREEACRHLVITLRGKQELRAKTLRSADTEAKRLERQINDQRKELEELAERDEDDGPETRRLGDSIKRPEALTRARELEELIAREQARLLAHRRWAHEEKRAIVNLESEISIAEDTADQAADAYSDAQRQENRTRR